MTKTQLREEIEQLLRRHEFPKDFKFEDQGEYNLQSCVVDLLGAGVLKTNTDLKMLRSVKGEAGTAPKILLLGTDFWPDIAIHSVSTGEKMLALELKLVSAKKSRAPAISSVVGQCLINRTMYSETIGFVLAYDDGRETDSRDQDELLKTKLETNGIRLIVRNHKMT